MTEKEHNSSNFNAEEWALQWQLFDQIINTAIDQQARVLQGIEQKHPTHYPALLELLASHRCELTVLDEPIIGINSTSTESIPKKIGGYQIIKPLGSGGLGDVYQARKDEEGFEHVVALKMAPAGRYSDLVLKSFNNELKMLLNLNHPNIERLFEGGVSSDNIPYLVVEYIDGLHIDQYCDQNRLAIKQRVELFVQVCEAVATLHQSLIIHRDIKPSNIMVDQQGTAKLLDFGMAKLLDKNPSDSVDEVTISSYMMTLAYASPEQITSQNITTASDVYSLGMLLYYLLCGQPPYKIENNDLAQASQQITQKIPPLASQNIFGDAVINQLHNSLKSQLKGELDAILVQAIHKDPKRRYSSAQQLANDLKNYLKNEPVLAKPDTLAYRMRKFIQRHTIGVLNASAVMLSLLILTILLLNRSQELQRALQATEEEKQRVSQVTEFLIDVFKLSDPLQNQIDIINVKDLLDYSSQQLDSQFNQQPATKSRLYQTLAQVYINMSDIEASEHLLNKAKLLKLKQTPIDSISGLLIEAEMLLNKGQFSAGLELLNSFDQNHPELELPVTTTLEMGLMKGEFLFKLGEYDLAIKTLKRSDQNLINHKDSNKTLKIQQLKADIQQILGHVYWRKGDFKQVEIYYQRSFDSNSLRLGPDNNATLKSLSSLGILAYVQGNFELAKTRFTHVLNSRIKELGPYHYITADAHNRLGATEYELGHLKAAETHYQEAMQGFETSGLSESIKLASVLNNLGLIKRQQTQYQAAEQLFNRALEIQTKQLDSHHPDLATEMNNLGLTSYDQGDFENALKLFKKAYQLQFDSTGLNNANIAFSMTNIGRMYLYLNQWDQSKEWINHALHLRSEHLGKDHLLFAVTLMAQAELEFVVKNHGKALKSAEEALKIRKNQLDEGDWRLSDTRNLLRTLNNESIEWHPQFCADAEIIKQRFGLNHPRANRTDQRMKWLSYPACHTNQ